MASKQQTSRRPRYYFDSNCFIAFFKNEAGRGETVYRLLQDAEQGKIEIVTSFLTLAEVFRSGTISAAGQALTDEDINAFFERPELELVALERFVAEKAREVRRIAPRLTKKFMVGDAIHVATALLSDVDALYSFDDDDLVKYDGVFEGMEITNPVWTGQMSLPIT